MACSELETMPGDAASTSRGCPSVWRAQCAASIDRIDTMNERTAAIAAAAEYIDLNIIIAPRAIRPKKRWTLGP